MFTAADFLARRIVFALSFLALMCVVGFGVSYCHQADKARRAQISERMTRGESAATNAATSAVIEYSERQSARDETTRNNHAQIHSAPNANDTAGAAGDAGLRGLCDRQAYRNDPVCLRLKDSAATSR